MSLRLYSLNPSTYVLELIWLLFTVLIIIESFVWFKWTKTLKKEKVLIRKDTDIALIELLIRHLKYEPIHGYNDPKTGIKIPTNINKKHKSYIDRKQLFSFVSADIFFN